MKNYKGTGPRRMLNNIEDQTVVVEDRYCNSGNVLIANFTFASKLFRYKIRN